MTKEPELVDDTELIHRLTAHLTRITEEASPEDGLLDRFHARIEQAGKAPAGTKRPRGRVVSRLHREKHTGRRSQGRSWHPRTVSGWLWAIGIAAVILALFPDPFYNYSGSGNSPFSNISTGLAGGGGGGNVVTPGTFGSGVNTGSPSLADGLVGVAGTAVGAIGSVAGNIVSVSGNSTQHGGHTVIAGPGNLPPNEQRTVALGYIIPDGSFTTSFNRMESIATSLGGYVSTSATSSRGGQRVVSGTMLIEIPSSKLSTFFDDIPPSFTNTYLDFSVKDYSSQVAQTEAKLKVDQETLAGLEQELATASTATSATYNQPQYIEAEIANLKNEIASETASLGSTASTVATTPVTLSLTEAAAVVSPLPPFVNALLSGWSNIVGIVSALLFILLTLAPFLLIGAGVYLLFRRRKLHLLSSYRARGKDFIPPAPSEGDGK